MRDASPMSHPEVFALYAGSVPARWQLLRGCTLMHKEHSRGPGVVEEVRPSGTNFILRVAHHATGQATTERLYGVTEHNFSTFFPDMLPTREVDCLLADMRVQLLVEAQHKAEVERQRQEEVRQRAAARQQAQPRQTNSVATRATAATTGEHPQRGQAAPGANPCSTRGAPIQQPRESVDRVAVRQVVVSAPRSEVIQAQVGVALVALYGPPRSSQPGAEYGARIYHFTSIKNLPNILAEGCLWCDGLRESKVSDHQNIAHGHIKDRRSTRRVPCHPGGVVADYVPFYFATRSPMLYAIHKGNVEGYQGGQRQLIYLVSSVGAVALSPNPWLFTDGNAVMGISRFYEDLRQLRRLDWLLLEAEIWKNTDDDQDRVRRRHAEFLVHRSFPWSLVHEIGVMDTMMAREVAATLAGHALQPPVIVRRGWYF